MSGRPDYQLIQLFFNKWNEFSKKKIESVSKNYFLLFFNTEKFLEIFFCPLNFVTDRKSKIFNICVFNHFLVFKDSKCSVHWCTRVENPRWAPWGFRSFPEGGPTFILGFERRMGPLFCILLTNLLKKFPRRVLFLSPSPLCASSGSSVSDLQKKIV